jgi:hypothetical protein
MHVVSVTPHARWMQWYWHRMHNEIFEQLQKVKIIERNGFAMQKKKKTCGVNDTAYTTNTQYSRVSWFLTFLPFQQISSGSLFIFIKKYDYLFKFLDPPASSAEGLTIRVTHHYM